VLPGTYTVTITDSLGCVRVDSVVVNFSTDIAGINNPGAVSMFPNPSNGVFQVNVNLNASTDITVFVTNTLGEVVATKTVNGIQNGRIDMSVDLAAGSYSLHVRSSDSEKIIPVTIQK
jgi:trimeric autotransporter adhesin